MEISCAWCKRHMGEKEPLEDRSVTHGICPPCGDESMAEMLVRPSPGTALSPIEGAGMQPDPGDRKCEIGAGVTQGSGGAFGPLKPL